MDEDIVICISVEGIRLVNLSYSIKIDDSSSGYNTVTKLGEECQLIVGNLYNSTYFAASLRYVINDLNDKFVCGMNSEIYNKCFVSLAKYRNDRLKEILK